MSPAAKKDLATTYSRGSYTATTIGKAAFDGRVRDGIGSGRCFVVTKKPGIEHALSENHTQRGKPNSLVEIALARKSEQAIKPHDRLVSVR